MDSLFYTLHIQVTALFLASAYCPYQLLPPSSTPASTAVEETTQCVLGANFSDFRTMHQHEMRTLDGNKLAQGVQAVLLLFNCFKRSVSKTCDTCQCRRRGCGTA
eukprot:6191805-Pleurochrysis_carterae.AAC.2